MSGALGRLASSLFEGRFDDALLEGREQTSWRVLVCWDITLLGCVMFRQGVARVNRVGVYGDGSDGTDLVDERPESDGFEGLSLDLELEDLTEGQRSGPREAKPTAFVGDCQRVHHELSGVREDLFGQRLSRSRIPFAADGADSDREARITARRGFGAVETGEVVPEVCLSLVLITDEEAG